MKKIKEFDKKAISLTTYRALFILTQLSKRPMSYDEILKAFSTDKYLSEFVHKDTISNSINSLRTAGFEIEKPKPSNNFKFELLLTPFRLNISEKQVNLLNLIRTTLYNQNNYRIIFNLSKILEQISDLTKDEKIKSKIEKSNYLRNINETTLDEILKLCIKKANAIITYDSPIHGKEELKIRAEKVIFENNRLYLWLYSYKYNAPTYLRIDKISTITEDLTNPATSGSLYNFVEYELTGNSAKNFIPKSNEVITEKFTNKIKIRANVINKFNFHQRIMLFGDECKITAPESAKIKFVEYLDNIIGAYENAEH